jgi:DNA-directed RNA polymerase subunit RPC12/RpoP
MFKKQTIWRCSKCGAEIENREYGGCCKECNGIWKPKGEFIIWEEDGEVWSTNSIFWRDFFK